MDKPSASQSKEVATVTNQDQPPESTRKRVTRALRNRQHAERMMAQAENGRDHIARLARRSDAQQLQDQAEEGLNRWFYTTNLPERGNGGELVPVFEPDDPMRRMVKKDTVQEPAGMLEQEASSHAMDLVADVGALSLALDVANGIKAKNRTERMLAHSAAALYKHGMDLMARAQKELERFDRHSLSGNTNLRQVASVEAARMTNAAGRAMGSMNDALLTLQKLRSGGKQVVQVVHQHVQVNEGGQAVVANSVKTGRKLPGAKGRGKRPK